MTFDLENNDGDARIVQRSTVQEFMTGLLRRALYKHKIDASHGSICRRSILRMCCNAQRLRYPRNGVA